ncbi:MAG: cupin domain-containing protein [Sphingomonas sp.]|nr:cupin domain-containing protein [Sphingomonas sp.]
MTVTVTRRDEASEADALTELSNAGFSAEAKDYPPGTTKPHQHDYDICLHIIEGEFRLNLVDDGDVRRCRPGDRVYVPAGTVHFEDHGPLRIIVGRRPATEGSEFSNSKGA